MDNRILIIILMIVVCETVAMTMVKKYHNQDGTAYLVLAVLMYAGVCLLLSQSLDYKDSVGMVNVVWSGLSIFAVVLAGVVFFHEKVHIHDLFAGSLITAGIIIFKYTQ